MSAANERRFLDAIALFRATRAPALACLVGVHDVGSDADRVKLGFREHAALTVIDLTMLADYALGAMARRCVGLDRTLPTMSLGVQLARMGTPDAMDVWATGTAVTLDDEYVIVGAGTLHHGSMVVGSCSGVFAKGSGGSPCLPWEQPPVSLPTLASREELTEAEQAALRVIEAADEARSWAEVIVSARYTFTDTDDPSVVRLDATALMTNRAGGVQGGVLMALAERSAQGLAGSGELISLHMSFVSAGDAAQPVIARSRVLRSARRTIASSTELRQDGRIVAVATALHRVVV